MAHVSNESRVHKSASAALILSCALALIVPTSSFAWPPQTDPRERLVACQREIILRATHNQNLDDSHLRLELTRTLGARSDVTSLLASWSADTPFSDFEWERLHALAASYRVVLNRHLSSQSTNQNIFRTASSYRLDLVVSGPADRIRQFFQDSEFLDLKLGFFEPITAGDRPASPHIGIVALSASESSGQRAQSIQSIAQADTPVLIYAQAQGIYITGMNERQFGDYRAHFPSTPTQPTTELHSTDEVIQNWDAWVGDIARGTRRIAIHQPGQPTIILTGITDLNAYLQFDRQRSRIQRDLLTFVGQTETRVRQNIFEQAVINANRYAASIEVPEVTVSSLISFANGYFSPDGMLALNNVHKPAFKLMRQGQPTLLGFDPQFVATRSITEILAVYRRLIQNPTFQFTERMLAYIERFQREYRANPAAVFGRVMEYQQLRSSAHPRERFAEASRAHTPTLFRGPVARGPHTLVVFFPIPTRRSASVIPFANSTEPPQLRSSTLITDEAFSNLLSQAEHLVSTAQVSALPYPLIQQLNSGLLVGPNGNRMRALLERIRVTDLLTWLELLLPAASRATPEQRNEYTRLLAQIASIVPTPAPPPALTPTAIAPTPSPTPTAPAAAHRDYETEVLSLDHEIVQRANPNPEIAFTQWRVRAQIANPTLIPNLVRDAGELLRNAGHASQRYLYPDPLDPNRFYLFWNRVYYHFERGPLDHSNRRVVFVMRAIQAGDDLRIQEIPAEIYTLIGDPVVNRLPRFRRSRPDSIPPTAAPDSSPSTTPGATRNVVSVVLPPPRSVTRSGLTYIVPPDVQIAQNMSQIAIKNVNTLLSLLIQGNDPTRIGRGTEQAVWNDERHLVRSTNYYRVRGRQTGRIILRRDGNTYTIIAIYEGHTSGTAENAGFRAVLEFERRHPEL